MSVSLSAKINNFIVYVMLNCVMLNKTFCFTEFHFVSFISWFIHFQIELFVSNSSSLITCKLNWIIINDYHDDDHLLHNTFDNLSHHHHDIFSLWHWTNDKSSQWTGRMKSVYDGASSCERNSWISTMNTEHWTLNTEYWTLNAERWTLNAEHWTLWSIWCRIMNIWSKLHQFKNMKYNSLALLCQFISVFQFSYAMCNVQEAYA